LVDFDNDGWRDVLIVTGSVYPEVEKIFKEYPHRGPRLVYQNLRNDAYGSCDPLAEIQPG
jgi:hypothetical protein